MKKFHSPIHFPITSTWTYLPTLFCLLIGSFSAFGQFNISVTVTGGTVNTICDDIFSNPDPMWAVSVEGGAFVNYPEAGNCFEPIPNTQYQETFLCIDDVPLQIQVCFRVFENDPNIFVNCDINESCLVEICADFPIPPQGPLAYVLPIPPGGDSDGELQFTIETSGFPGAFNDEPCDAIDFGVIDFNQSAGDADTSIFNNFCATNANEPNDFGVIGFWNNNAVWFQFTTGSNPGAVNKIIGTTDPSGFGDDLGMQIGLFEELNGDCTNLDPIGGASTTPVGDESFISYCLDPNTTYYIIMDGDGVNNGDSLFGYFGMEVIDLGAIEGADFICDADDLGIIPDGGMVESELTSNGCATNTTDPSAQGIFNGKGVWFEFQPPASGHIFVNVENDPTGEDPINTEFAILESTNNACNGVFSTVISSSNNSLLTESQEVSCLDPNKTYFILVDGQGTSSFRSGIFQVSIADAGDDTPIEDQEFTLCFGETLEVGTSIYTESGIYSDTIILQNGCDSIVNTNLTVLSEIFFELDIQQPGIGVGEPNGITTITASGGAGVFIYNWDNAVVGQTANNLIGEETYCVSVIDTSGCESDTCFIQPLVLHFLPIIPNDTLNCSGDMNGELSVSATFGFPPYEFMWESADGNFDGNGTLVNAGDTEVFSNLPAGMYSISISDMMFDTIVAVEIWEPDPITLSMETIIDASCFGVPDGSISIDIIGGTPPYLTDWSNGVNVATSINGLEAGDYNVVIADDNSCVVQFFFEVEEPDSIILTLDATPVSCFEGDDGIVSVESPNANLVAYLWDTGDMTPLVGGLTGGTYNVGVQADDGCFAVGSIEVETPDAPLEVMIDLDLPIVCNGGNDGQLTAFVTGPGNVINYQWSNGIVGAFNANLGAGVYAVTATNENGCESSITFNLTEPDEIFAQFSTMGVTCPGGLTDGVLTVDTIIGGVGPYLFSDNGFNFSAQMEFTDQIAGSLTLFVQDALGCTIPFEALIEDVPNVSVDLGDDLSVELGDSIDITAATTLGGLVYTWEPAGLVSCQDCPKVFVRPMGDVEVTVTVFDPVSECSDTDEIFIEVIKSRRFYAPNAFSPNDDGFNDVFMVFGDTDVQAVRTLKIFNRYGAMVFEANDFQPNSPAVSWDGMFKGKRLNPDVYGWFAEVEFFDGAREIYRGDVVIVR